jgi:hypothetical protein
LSFYAEAYEAQHSLPELTSRNENAVAVAKAKRLPKASDLVSANVQSNLQK